MFLSMFIANSSLIYLFYILCCIYIATSIIRSLFHIHKPHLGFSCSYFSYTPTAWVFSPESFSLRPFRHQTILSAHHLWVFPPSASPLRPPRGFSPRKVSLCAHFVIKPHSPHIISGFFRSLPLPYAHRVGFLP